MTKDSRFGNYFAQTETTIKEHLKILKLVNPRVQQLHNLALARLHRALRLRVVLVALVRLERPLVVTIRSVRKLNITRLLQHPRRQCKQCPKPRSPPNRRKQPT